MIRSYSQNKNFISEVTPTLLIHLKYSLYYAQDDYFDCQIESSRKRNYLKKTIHHPNIASKNISALRGISFLSAPLDQGFDKYNFEPFNIIPIISSCVQYSKNLETLSVEFERQKKQNIKLFFNKMSHILSLKSLDIKLDIFKSNVDENMFRQVIKSLKSQLELHNLKIFISSKLMKKALGVFSQLLKRLNKLEIFHLRILGTNEVLKAELLEFLTRLEYLSNLKNLNIRINVPRLEFYKISDSLCKLTKLEFLELNFTYNICPDDMLSFFSVLKNLQKIKELNLQIARVMSISLIAAYSEALEHLVLLEKMTTNINYYKSVEGIELIPKSLAKLHNFNSLNLSINFTEFKISSPKFYHELRLITGLEYLNLYIDDPLELEQLSYTLGHLSKLKLLNFKITQDSKIDSAENSIIRICETIGTLNFLSKIDLMIGKGMLTESVIILALSCIRDLKHLKHFGLNICPTVVILLSQQPFLKFYEISPYLLGLESLDLSFNNIGLDQNALDPFQMAIQELAALKSFNLNIRLDTTLTNEFVAGIIRSLAHLETIEEICLKLNSNQNLMDFEIYQIFDDYFKSKQSLKATNLSFGLIIDENYDVCFLEIKKKYSSLKKKKALLIDSY